MPFAFPFAGELPLHSGTLSGRFLEVFSFSRTMPLEEKALKTRPRLRKAVCSPVFIVCMAFAVRSLALCFAWRRGFENGPYAFEAGRVAQSIASGHGFSSPLATVHDRTHRLAMSYFPLPDGGGLSHLGDIHFQIPGGDSDFELHLRFAHHLSHLRYCQKILWNGHRLACVVALGFSSISDPQTGGGYLGHHSDSASVRAHFLGHTCRAG